MMIYRCLIVLFFSMAISANVSAEKYAIQHLEPANWWVGMKYNQVQLLVHGEAIAELEPRLNYKGVKIVDVTRVANPNYLFVTLSIAKSAKPGQFDIEFIADKKINARFTYTLDARAKDSAQREGFSSADAIYLITPDRFANGDPHNDSHSAMTEPANRTDKNGRHGGDLAGMTQHLDYIAAMGFTQIWPSPLLENNQPKYSYHGYAATDLYRIDPRFGTNADFKSFVAQARKKDIGVIQDIILNHIGSQHWWMKDLPTQDWLNHQQSYHETNHRRTTIQDPYAAPADKNSFVNGWFTPQMPDLNQRNPLLARYLIQNSLWWVEYAGLSGIREDTYGYADEEFLSQWAKVLMEEYPNFNIVGEEWSNNPAVVAHWQKGKHNTSGHVSYLPSLMDFPLHETLRTALLEEESWNQGFIQLYEMLANDFLYPDPFNLVVFPENHDTSRIYSYLHEDLDLFKMAMVYTATMRGIPQFYYGSEVLITSPRERDDGAVRADMPGGWAGDKVNAFTGKGLDQQQVDAQTTLKKLLNWRKETSVIHDGKLQHFAPENGTYVYFRYNTEQAAMVILNKNNESQQLDLTRFADRLKNANSGVNIITQERVDLKQSLMLNAKSATVIQLQY